MKRGFRTPVKSQTPKRWFTPSPTNKNQLQLTGYIVHIGYITTGTTGNTYFDTNLKVSEDEFKAIRVMAYDDERSLFIENRDVPVTVTVMDSSDTLFYNVKRGSKLEQKVYALDFTPNIPITPIGSILKSTVENMFILGAIKWIEKERQVKGNNLVRECVIKDESGEIVLTVWNTMINNMEEDKWYRISDIEVKEWYGVKLSTTRRSISEAVKKPPGSVTWNEETLKHFFQNTKEATSLISIINVVSANITELYACPICEHPLPATMQQKVCKCVTCDRKVNMMHSKRVFNGEMEAIQNDGSSVSLTFELPPFWIIFQVLREKQTNMVT